MVPRIQLGNAWEHNWGTHGPGDLNVTKKTNKQTTELNGWNPY